MKGRRKGTGSLVLVVDDEPHLRSALTKLLKAEQYTVLTAADGETALRISRQKLPDIVLLDVAIPAPDGREICRQIRQFSKTTRMVYFTGMVEGYRHQPSMQELMLEADALIAKPASARTILAELRRVLEKSRDKQGGGGGNASPMIRVLVVDDHQVVREGLCRILAADGDIEVVGQAQNGQEAIQQAVHLVPDVIVMDLKMPGMDGIEATREIKEKCPSTNVLMLTLYAEDVLAEAVEAGVSGYLLKDSSMSQITASVHEVYDGGSPISPSLTRGLMTEFAHLSKTTRTGLLNERQTQIMKLVAEGMTGAEMGKRLFMSPSTVKRELRNIFNKLGVNDRTHAVAEATRKRLI